MSHYMLVKFIVDEIKSAWNQTDWTLGFATAPFDDQPSGTCNFSKSDVNLNIVFANDAGANGTIIKNKNVYFFAVNYNVLRIIRHGW